MFVKNWLIGFFLGLVFISVISSCSNLTYYSPTGHPALTRGFTTHQNSSANLERPVPKMIQRMGPFGSLQSEETITQVKEAQNKSFILTMNYTPQGGFTLNALRCGEIAKLKIYITGIGIASPIYPTGIDGNNQIDATAGCTTSAIIPNVPFGTARIATVEAYNSSSTLIAGSTIKAVFNVSANPTNVNMGFDTTPAGYIIEQLITSSNHFIAAYLNLSNLQNLLNTMTGVSGTFPNLTYTYHPALINTSPMATDLIANDGDSLALNPSNPAYKITPGTVTGTLAGLVSNDAVTLHVTDPASSLQAGNSNGSFTLNMVAPGTWEVLATALGGTNYTVSGTPSVIVPTGGSGDIGTITFIPATPTITGLSTSSGTPGDTVTITGTNFHTNPDGNLVQFGSATVLPELITIVNSTQMNVIVPPTGSGTLSVTVSVGSQTSNALAFTVLPKITGVSPGTGYNDEITTIDVFGGGFQSGATVDIGPLAATGVTFVNATRLTAEVPSGLALGFYNVKVTNPDSNQATLPNGFKSISYQIIWAEAGITPPSVQALAIDPLDDQTLYAGTGGSSGIFKSGDEGQYWANSSNGLPSTSIRGVTIAPNNNSILYAATSNGVFKSLDAGYIWSATGSGHNTNTIAVNPLNENIVYAGQPNGMKKSTDGGTSWTNINTGLGSANIKSIVIHPTNPNTIYTITDGGTVFKTINGGTNWSSSGTGLTSYDVEGLIFDPQTPTTIYVGTDGHGIRKSTNGGTTWSSANAGLTDLDVELIMINPQTPSILYIGTDGNGIFKTTNGGSNWSTSNNGLSDLHIKNMLISPSTPNKLYVNTNDGVFRSIDGGANWTEGNSPLPDDNVRDIYIHPTVPNNIMIATEDGIYASSDSGANWVARNTGLSNRDVRTLVANSGNLFAGTSNGVYKSTNSGISWTLANTGLSDTNVRDLILDPSTPSTLYVATAGGVYTSVDSASTWNVINSGLSNLNVHALAINSSTPAILYAATEGGGVFKTINSGSLWSSSSTGISSPQNVRALAVDPLTPINLYSGLNSNGRLFKTSNSANNWSLSNTGLPNTVLNTLTIELGNSNIIYTGTSNSGVYRSVDGGMNWLAENTGLPSGQNINVIAIDPTHSKTIYLGTTDGFFRTMN